MGLLPVRPLPKTAVDDVWRHTLSRIPTVFGRLAYLASLRNANTGLYSHQGLAMRFGEEEAEAALRVSHERAFAEWLEHGLEGQRADVEAYLDGLNESRGVVLANWRRLTPYEWFVPASADGMERDLYRADMRQILEALTPAIGAAGLAQGS